ncbi:integrase, catalytic region, zinc finger, CCHC-type containing protein [Tanacetum coccineum]
MIEFPQLDSGLVVPVFTQGDDPIACHNKAMAFLSLVAVSRFPSTNNQLRTYSNPRNQATIQNDRFGGNNAGGQARVVKCYNCQGEGHMARQCTQPKRPRNAAWFKDKAMLAEAHESGQILDEVKLAFLAYPGIPDGQAAQTTILSNATFQTEDLDAYDSDCHDVSNAKAVLRANLSNYSSDVISEVSHSESYHNDLDNQSLAVPVFTQGDDPISCLNKAMAFLSAGNATSSGGNNVGGQARVVKCYNCHGEGHMARQCTQPKRPRNVAWFKDKARLAKAQESGQILDEEQLALLADPGIPDGQAAQTTIPSNAAFQTKDLDAYDFDCDDVSNAKTVWMANISNYGLDVILEVPHSESYHNDLDNQSVHAMQDFEQTPVVDFPDNGIISDSNIISYSQYLQETQ